MGSQDEARTVRVAVVQAGSIPFDTKACVDKARAGQGPSFIQASTYRIRGHVETEQSILQRPYRTEEEIEAWKARDPLVKARKRLLEIRSEGEVLALESEVEASVQVAFEKAQAAEDPAPSSQ